MRRRNAALAVLALFVIATLMTPLVPAGAQSTTDGYTFSETGFTVPNAFYNYWQKNGGLAIFGYPISAAATEGKYTVQYFERNRFELHPENAGTENEVQLSLLGALLTDGRDFAGPQVITTSDDRTYFPETHHTIAGAFLKYWQANGGLRIFGYPLSEEFQENGFTVQYFERNRFEFHPEIADANNQVLLGLLGRDYLALKQRGQISGTGAAVPTVATTPGTGAAPKTSPTPTGYTPLTITTNKGPHVGYGMIVHMYFQDHDRILKAVQDLGFNWIKQQVVWADTEPAPGEYHWWELDHIVDSAQRYNMNLLLSVVRSPDWAAAEHGFPDNPDNYREFMQTLATRYKGRVKAYEIWNEQNLAIETAGQHKNPEKYAAVLEAGFLGARAGDPTAVVLSGALAPTGVYTKDAYEDTWYLDQLYKWKNGELRNYFDSVAVHPYGYWNPPDTMWPVKKPSDQTPAAEFKSHGSFYFRRVEDQRAIMEKYGDSSKQVWVTEFGWCSDQREGGYVECQGNSLDDQAKYLARAFEMSKQNYPWMGVMFVWNLNFSTFQEWYTGPSHFSILNGDWSQRPAYWALKNLVKQ